MRPTVLRTMTSKKAKAKRTKAVAKPKNRAEWAAEIRAAFDSWRKHTVQDILKIGRTFNLHAGQHRE